MTAIELPYKVATLLYIFNHQDRVLLLERAQEPNEGLWSPPGGKLNKSQGESPYVCAVREASEETGMQLSTNDLHLTGIVSEQGYQGTAHWLMFLFEVKRELNKTPKVNREGRFKFFPHEQLSEIPLPRTDRDMIWPLFWKHRRGFFSAHCHCTEVPDEDRWTIEESCPPVDLR